jgi:hypothetical protein
VPPIAPSPSLMPSRRLLLTICNPILPSLLPTKSF